VWGGYDTQIPSRNYATEPKYNQPGAVDILIGAELFFSILKTKKYVLISRLAKG